MKTEVTGEARRGRVARLVTEALHAFTHQIPVMRLLVVLRVALKDHPIWRTTPTEFGIFGSDTETYAVLRRLRTFKLVAKIPKGISAVPLKLTPAGERIADAIAHGEPYLRLCAEQIHANERLHAFAACFRDHVSRYADDLVSDGVAASRDDAYRLGRTLEAFGLVVVIAADHPIHAPEGASSRSDWRFQRCWTLPAALAMAADVTKPEAREGHSSSRSRKDGTPCTPSKRKS